MVEARVDVKIGIADSGRELTVTVTDTPDEIQQQVAEALQGESTRTLTDEKGRWVIVATAKVAHVEIGPADGRRVGFSAS
jgi:hypothetical protein